MKYVKAIYLLITYPFRFRRQRRFVEQFVIHNHDLSEDLTDLVFHGVTAFEEIEKWYDADHFDINVLDKFCCE